MNNLQHSELKPEVKYTVIIDGFSAKYHRLQLLRATCFELLKAYGTMAACANKQNISACSNLSA
jgi:hypothetical protein